MCKGILAILLAAASLQAAPHAGAPLRIHGGTVMVKSKAHATIFLVRNGNGDGPAEHLFQVWANPGLPLDAVYRGADVEFSGSALVIVVPAEKSVSTFTVAGQKTPAIPIPEGFSTTTYEVAGVNHTTGAGIERLNVNTGGHSSGRLSTNECYDCGALPFEDPWGAGGSGTCNSGGMFATSCSQSGTGGSCSVTCSGSGVYACCNAGSPPSCTCKQM
ncbi:MAG TPA: hypothetical protein VI670_05820 [Thermoanaerobaculia bacterium]|jgi:hypothetical protein